MKGQWENAISGEQLDIVQKEMRGNFRHDDSKRGNLTQSSSLAPKTETQTDGRKPSKGFGPRGESPSGRKAQKACQKFFKVTCTNSTCS